ncbi:MAG: ABC transporter permease [Candidatus Aenigmatarchaeota archaeon]
MIDIALKELTAHRMRTVLTGLGIFIAITAIVSLGSISAGVNNLVTTTTSSVGSDTIFVMKALDLSHMSGPPGSQMSDLTAEDVAAIASLPGVKRAVPVITRTIGGFTGVRGISIDDIDLLGKQDVGFKEGGWPENGNMEAALGYIAANTMGVGVGDYLVLNGNEVQVTGIFEEGSGAFDLVVVIPYEAANDIYKADGGATQVVVEPDDVSIVNELKQAIEGEVDGVTAMTMKETLSMMQDMTATLNVMTFGIGFIASLVAAIGIIITMYTSVVERRRQIGIMKATGALGRAIMKQVLEEAAIISVAASLLAVLSSLFMVALLNQVLLGGTQIAIVTPGLAAGAVAYGIVLTLLSALYPARMAVKVDPITAIREG